MKKTTVFLSILLTTLSLSNCYAKTTSELFKKNIETGKAKEVRTDISFFAGELNINAETDFLAECVYGYRDGYLRPEMTYREVGTVGYLTVESEEKHKLLSDDTNRWNLSLNKKIKNNIDIELKAGKANIDLEGCNLNNFYYKMTAGESNINLRNTSVPHVKFNMTAGEATIDLSGEWKNNMVADIKGGIGEISVMVPFNTGVKIFVSGVLGEVNIPFFNKEGNMYTNDNYKKTKYNLTLYINGAIGQINVKMKE